MNTYGKCFKRLEKRRKTQSIIVKIIAMPTFMQDPNNASKLSGLISFGVPQGSIMGFLSFNNSTLILSY